MTPTPAGATPAVPRALDAPRLVPAGWLVGLPNEPLLERAYWTHEPKADDLRLIGQPGLEVLRVFGAAPEVAASHPGPITMLDDDTSIETSEAEARPWTEAAAAHMREADRMRGAPPDFLGARGSALVRVLQHPVVLELMADAASAIDTENFSMHEPGIGDAPYDGSTWVALEAELRAQAARIRAEDPEIWPLLAHGADARDAARYRWLRGGKARKPATRKSEGLVEVYLWEDSTLANALKGEQLDAVVDAAIARRDVAAEGGPQHG